MFVEILGTVFYHLISFNLPQSHTISLFILSSLAEVRKPACLRKQLFSESQFLVTMLSFKSAVS